MERLRRLTAQQGVGGESTAGFPYGTPMVEIRLPICGRERRLRLKLEAANPTGSSKYRTACSLLDGLEREDRLEPGATVVESSSGNLALALAALCRARGYRFTAVVDPHTAPSHLTKIEALGGAVEIADRPDQHGSYLGSRLGRVRDLVRQHGHVWTNQYANPANVQAHLDQTGPEIWCQTSEHFDVLLCAVSTGGTLAGVSRFLRAVTPELTIVAVDTLGSVAVGGPAGPRGLVGIGSAVRSAFLVPADYDEGRLVSTGDAVSHCRGLAAATGLHVGGSSGAVLAAAFTYFESHPDEDVAVCVCADGGDRYTTSIYDDDWAATRGFVVRTQAMTAYADARVTWTTSVGLSLADECRQALSLQPPADPLLAAAS
jgi:N-(2-amino-2-carboxyethyl)-L-glutamate synthase